jgi:nitroreductase
MTSHQDAAKEAFDGEPPGGLSFADTIRRQRMVRPPFQDRAVPREVVEQLLRNAQKAPSAGFSQGFAFVVLEGAQTELFWKLTMPAKPEQSTTTPVVIIPLENAQAYLERYRQPDKQATGLGEGEASWPVPYWTVDTAFASMILLLSATAAGLGAWFFGIFNGEKELMAALGIPSEFKPIGAIALGYRAGDELRSPSLTRGRKALSDIVRWGHW